ncbi:MAG: O-antigen ligase family protein [Oscillospiraceae bacterium]|nr:O-antigen ligase family protein [Oscillospiraceae bacterium]
MANTNLQLHTSAYLPRAEYRRRVYTSLPSLTQNPAQEAAERFWQSRLYFPVLFAVAALFLMAGEGVAGGILLVAFACFMLVFCSDLFSCLFPFLLTIFVTIDYFSDYTALLPYWYIAIPILVALLYHQSKYAVKVHIGVCFSGLVMVAAATLLGGVGRISLQTYFKPVSLYYTVGLGAVMLLVYLGVKSQSAQGCRSRMLSKFLTILYVSGLFVALLLARYYLMHLREFLATFSVQELCCRNFCATILLLALPISFQKALTRPLHLIGAVVIYLAILLTGSRSGLLLGSLLVLLGIVYLLRYDARRRNVYQMALLLGSVPVLLLGYVLVSSLFSSRMVDGNFISSYDNVRLEFLVQALRDFNNNPMFGQGLVCTANRDIFEGAPGSMIFYHNYFAQIIGSMGLVGLAAYGFQFFGRVRLLWSKRSPLVVAAALSFLGVFLMSMTNPGEFCPLPNELLVVLLFALLEDCPDHAGAACPGTVQ